MMIRQNRIGGEALVMMNEANNAPDLSRSVVAFPTQYNWLLVTIDSFTYLLTHSLYFTTSLHMMMKSIRVTAALARRGMGAGVGRRFRSSASGSVVVDNEHVVVVSRPVGPFQMVSE